jgi:hypothetical protein
MIVQVSKSGGIESVISDVLSETAGLVDGDVLAEPAVEAIEAQQIVIEWMEQQYQQYGNLEYEATEPELMIYAPSVVGGIGDVRLVWQMETSNTGETMASEYVLVDAHNGEIAFNYSLIRNAVYRQIYDCNGGTVATLVR